MAKVVDLHECKSVHVRLITGTPQQQTEIQGDKTWTMVGRRDLVGVVLANQGKDQGRDWLATQVASSDVKEYRSPADNLFPPLRTRWARPFL